MNNNIMFCFFLYISKYSKTKLVLPFGLNQSLEIAPCTYRYYSNVTW